MAALPSSDHSSNDYGEKTYEEQNSSNGEWAEEKLLLQAKSKVYNACGIGCGSLILIREEICANCVR